MMIPFELPVPYYEYHLFLIQKNFFLIRGNGDNSSSAQGARLRETVTGESSMHSEHQPQVRPSLDSPPNPFHAAQSKTQSDVSLVDCVLIIWQENGYTL